MNLHGPNPAGWHLDDEGFSAALDERADARQLAHLAACEQCQASLAAWRGAQAAWAVAPERAEVGQVEAAVQVALSRAGAVRREPIRNLRRAVMRRPPRWAVPALAAALAVVLGVGLLARGQPNRNFTSSRATSSGAARAPASRAEHGSSARPEIPAHGASASLGAIAGPQELARVLRPRLAAGSPELGSLPAGSATCRVEARQAARVPGATTPIYVARLRYRGVAAHVTVFKRGGSRLAVVTGDRGCGVLTTTPV